MHSEHRIPVLVSLSLWLVLLGMDPAARASPPVPVSPSGMAATTCPTFSWSQAGGTTGYDLVVYSVEEDGNVAEAPFLQATMPAGTQSWTPSADRCLTRGATYAWSVRTRGEEEAGRWSSPLLVETAAEPSLSEVESAIATLRRYLRERGDGSRPGAGFLPGDDRGSSSTQTEEPSSSSRAEDRPDAPEATPEHIARAGYRATGSLTGDAAGTAGMTQRSAAVALSSTPSLTLSDQLHLDADSDLFKNGQPFLWDDSYNLALGRDALGSASGTATGNVAVGAEALESTTEGSKAVFGSHNTALGEGALHDNTYGYSNTATGAWALLSNTTGDGNTASGHKALFENTTGSSNTAVGYEALRRTDGVSANTATGHQALRNNTTGSKNAAFGASSLYENSTGYSNTAVGYEALAANTTGWRNTAIGKGALMRANGNRSTALGAYALYHLATGSENIAIGNRAGLKLNFGVSCGSSTMSDNILIGNEGDGCDQDTIRIGDFQESTFVAGIHGVTPGSDAVDVVIDTYGQLGTIVSTRSSKQEIRDLGGLSDRLLELRPVVFRYREQVAEDPEAPVEFGLIAEEVAEVFPELVVYSEDGAPRTVKYRLLSTLLLGELQEERRRLEAVERRLDELERSVRRDGP